MTWDPAAQAAVAFGIALIAGLAALVVASYQRFVRQHDLVRESWLRVDVELHRRYALALDLATATRSAGMAAGASTDVAQLCRRAAGDLALAERARLESELSGALRRLFATVDGGLAGLAELRQLLAETEDRIAAGRRFYNANVDAYNLRVESLPPRLIAARFRFRTAGSFDLAEDQVRSVPIPAG